MTSPIDQCEKPVDRLFGSSGANNARARNLRNPRQHNPIPIGEYRGGCMSRTAPFAKARGGRFVRRSLSRRTQGSGVGSSAHNYPPLPHRGPVEVIRVRWSGDEGDVIRRGSIRRDQQVRKCVRIWREPEYVSERKVMRMPL